MTHDRLYDLNTKVASAITKLDAMSDGFNEHKKFTETMWVDIKKLIEKQEARNDQQDERLNSHDESRTWARAAMWVIGVLGGAIGTFVGFIVKALAH